MSNVQVEKIQYNADFMKADLAGSEYKIKDEYGSFIAEQKQHQTANQTPVSATRLNATTADQQQSQPLQHSCFYNSVPPVPPNTILITNNYSQIDNGPSVVSNCLNSTNVKKSSSITIVTHNSDSDHSASSMPASAINICINNHFNDPGSNLQSLQKSALVKTEQIYHPAMSPATQSQPQSTVSSHVHIVAAALPHDSGVAPATASSEKSMQEPDSTTASTTTSPPSNGHESPANSAEPNSSSTSLFASSLSVSSACPKESLKQTTSDSPATTTTTTALEFCIGQDVLVQRKDTRFYLGTIVSIAREQCLVKFDDNTEYWSTFDELSKLKSNDTSNDPVCVVCKKLNSCEVVEVCERCGRGYHQKCAEGSFQKNGIWYCRRCTAPNGFKFKSADFNSETDKNYRLNGVQNSPNQISHKSQLPYNIDSLQWDDHHRVNFEQIYCYCGGNGEWYNKMLQCCKCQQWFHEKCVQCLDYPVYCGDRFYVFVCSMCNYGTEFIRRIEMKWNDVVHLLLFNITINNQKKYYHVNKAIVPYAIDNWSILQLGFSMHNLSSSEIRDNVIKTLKNHNSRFKCGKEIKKQQSFWGLRLRIPPPAPKIDIPPEVDPSDHYIKHNTKLIIISQRSLVPIPKDIDAKMHGAIYLGENSDGESSGGISGDQKPPFDVEVLLKIKQDDDKSSLESKSDGLSNTRLDALSVNEDSTTNGFDLSEKPIHHDSFEDFDVVKEESLDVDDVVVKPDTFTSLNIKGGRKRKSPFLSSLIQQSAAAAATDPRNNSEIIDICDSSDETSSRGTLDLIIPPPKNFQGRNNPFRLTPKKSDNNKLDKLMNSEARKVAAKQSGVVMPLFSGNGNDINHTTAGQFRIVRTVKRRLSAKDIMIGPNKEIKRRRLRRRSGNVEVISTATLQTLPKSAAYLPIRTDSKDWAVSAIRSTLNSASSSSSSTPQATTPTNIVGSISNVFYGRRLRQRQQGKNYSENPRRNSNTSLTGISLGGGGGGGSANSTLVHGITSLPGSPSKLGTSSGSNNQSESMSDLHTSLNMYFGAANRISNGENFIVRGKRLSPSGKTQYLIEWEGIS